MGVMLGEMEDSDEGSTISYTIKRFRRIEVPLSDSTLFSSSLVENCRRMRAPGAAVLHTRSDFSWEMESADAQEEGFIGNEAGTVAKWYHRSAIVLLHRHLRWRFIAESISAPHLLAEFRRMVASQRMKVESTEVIDFARAVHRAVQGKQLHVQFLVSLAALDLPYISVTSSSISTFPSSSQQKLILDELLNLSTIDFDDSALASWLDVLANVRGIDWLTPRLVQAFGLNLYRSRPPASANAVEKLNRLAAARLLFGFFSLPSVSPDVEVADGCTSLCAPPTYDGGETSIRLICRFLLSSKDPSAMVPFPAELSKKARQRIRAITQEMAPRGELQLESVKSSQRKVLRFRRQRARQSTCVLKPVEDESEDLFLRVINAAQPLIPTRWLPAVSSMLDLLCVEIGQATTSKGQLDFVDTNVEVLSLLCLYHNQSLLNKEQRSSYTSRYHPAARSMVAELAQALQVVASKEAATDGQKKGPLVSANSARILSIERGLISRLLSLQLAVAECERSCLNLAVSSSLLPAFFPLTQWLQCWVEGQQCGLQQLSATSWVYPSTTSPLFDPPRSSFSSPGSPWCRCDLCKTLQCFLQSSEKSKVNIQASSSQRRHLRDRIEALHNPHLRHEAQCKNQFHVTKTLPLALLVQQRSDRLQQVYNQLQEVLSRISPFSDPPAAVLAVEAREGLVVEVDEMEVQDKAGKGQCHRHTARQSPRHLRRDSSTAADDCDLHPGRDQINARSAASSRLYQLECKAVQPTEQNRHKRTRSGHRTE